MMVCRMKRKYKSIYKNSRFLLHNFRTVGALQSKKKIPFRNNFLLRKGITERWTGVEPASPAWEAGVMPLYDHRASRSE